MKRFASLLAAASIVGGGGALAVTDAAATASPGASSALPTLTVALTGTHGIAVSGSMVSGAVNVVSTYSGKGTGEFGIFRLSPGASFAQASNAVPSHHGDLNALTPYGSLFVDAAAPGSVQTVLTPGTYVALNITGNGPAAAEPFAVTPSSSPAALPAAAATETLDRVRLQGAQRAARRHHRPRAERRVPGPHGRPDRGAGTPATGRELITLLKAGKNRAARKLRKRVRQPDRSRVAGGDAAGGSQREARLLRPGVLHEHRGWSRPHAARDGAPDPGGQVNANGQLRPDAEAARLRSRGRRAGLLALAVMFSAGIHSALVPEHLKEMPPLGWSFIAAAAIGAALACALVASPEDQRFGQARRRVPRGRGARSGAVRDRQGSPASAVPLSRSRRSRWSARPAS